MGIEHSGGTGMHKKNPGFSKMFAKKILQINEETLHCFFIFRLISVLTV